MNTVVIFMVLVTAALIVWMAYSMDYEHTGCYLLFQPSPSSSSSSSQTIDEKAERVVDNVDSTSTSISASSSDPLAASTDTISEEEFDHLHPNTIQHQYPDESRLVRLRDMYTYMCAFIIQI